MKKTPIFIITVIIAIAVFDVWVIIDSGKTESISATMIRWSHEFPSFPFLLGFTMGHLMWRMKDKDIYIKELK